MIAANIHLESVLVIEIRGNRHLFFNLKEFTHSSVSSLDPLSTPLLSETEAVWQRRCNFTLSRHVDVLYRTLLPVRFFSSSG